MEKKGGAGSVTVHRDESMEVSFVISWSEGAIRFREKMGQWLDIV